MRGDRYHEDGGSMMIQLKDFFREESGATAIEYSMIAALFGLIAIGALGTIAGPLENTFNSIATTMNSPNP